jgi:hypothetical protein
MSVQLSKALLTNDPDDFVFHRQHALEALATVQQISFDILVGNDGLPASSSGSPVIVRRLLLLRLPAFTSQFGHFACPTALWSCTILIMAADIGIRCLCPHPHPLAPCVPGCHPADKRLSRNLGPNCLCRSVLRGAGQGLGSRLAVL